MTEIEQLLADSRAEDDFKADVLAFCATGGVGRGADGGGGGGGGRRIEVKGYLPTVKVKRLLKHMLATAPDLPIERVSLQGQSGCSDFTGTVHVETAGEKHSFEFAWDCRWRAEQEGWTDYFGFPDQIRAAREFDWRCFKVWRAAN